MQNNITREANIGQRPSGRPGRSGLIAALVVVAILSVGCGASGSSPELIRNTATTSTGAEPPAAEISPVSTAADQAGAGGANATDKADTVLLLGDSLMYQTAPVVKAQLDENATVVSYATPGEGLLAAPQAWMLDWHQDIARLIDEHHPDVIVAEFVGNYNAAHALGADGTPIEPRTERFYEAWMAATDQALDLITASGADAYWVIPPQMNLPIDPGLGAHTQRVADLYRTHLPTTWPDIELIDWMDRFGAGTYNPEAADASGAIVVAREIDGVHFTPAGTEIAAATITGALEAPQTQS